MEGFEIPIIGTEEPLFDVIPKLFNFIRMAVGDMAYTFEQMMHGPQGHRLRQLVHVLAQDSHNPFIIVALMILKWDFTTATEDDWGLNESRGAACEFVAWQFLCHLNQRETIEFLLEELPSPRRNSTNEAEASFSGLVSPQSGIRHTEGETVPLLPNLSTFNRFFGNAGHADTDNSGTSPNRTQQDLPYTIQRYSQFFGLNALEIATIAHAKRFLSQRVVQRVVDGIWKGEIVFWDSLTVNSTKKPHTYNTRTADPYSRLRVPVYRKIFEAVFFISFLALYYAVLIERRQDAIGLFEAVMYVWIVAFAYDELSGIVDAGVVFYQMDFWSLWNLGIIGVGIAFVITRVIGLARGDTAVIDLSFDILSLEALFLVPRQDSSCICLCRWATGLTRDEQDLLARELEFILRQSNSGIERDGFLTTFTMLARDRLSISAMAHLLVKVFFGSSVLGLISPIFGYGLMLAIYVLESSNSRRLTYFMPPLNLIPLLCIRPMRLFLSAGTVRRVRIILLRATHIPFVALIWIYEAKWRNLKRQNTQRPPASARGRTSANETSSGWQDPHHLSVVETNLSSGKERIVDQQAAREPHVEVGHVQLAELIDTVERLRAQVEALAGQK
ncbi:hypothetical protein MYU51_014887 [Penicillium brevicompactum]